MAEGPAGLEPGDPLHRVRSLPVLPARRGNPAYLAAFYWEGAARR